MLCVRCAYSSHAERRPSLCDVKPIQNAKRSPKCSDSWPGSFQGSLGPDLSSPFSKAVATLSVWGGGASVCGVLLGRRPECTHPDMVLITAGEGSAVRGCPSRSVPVPSSASGGIISSSGRRQAGSMRASGSRRPGHTSCWQNLWAVTLVKAFNVLEPSSSRVKSKGSNSGHMRWL